MQLCLPVFLPLFLTIFLLIYDAKVKDIFPFAAGCSIDIAMGFDISQRTGASGEMLVSGHPKLETFLPEIASRISSVEGLCCLKSETITTNIAYQVVSQTGHPIHDFSFEPYNEDIVRKVMTLTLKEPTYFNTDLLRSFSRKFSQSNAGVKVSL